MATTVKLPSSWFLLVYRVPSEPSRNRVGVWREMKRMGALYLQNCVCLVPGFAGMKPRLTEVQERVTGLGGSSLLFQMSRIAEPELTEIIDSFKALSDREYLEIVEECSTKFQKEIEFERFRGNFSYEEAEEIFSDLEKIKDWLRRTVDRDWFGSPRRKEAEKLVAESETLYEAFERECFAASGEESELGRGPASEALIRTASTHPGLPHRRNNRKKPRKPSTKA